MNYAYNLEGKSLGAEFGVRDCLDWPRTSKFKRFRVICPTFCFLSGLLHTESHFSSATLTSAGKQSEIMLNTNLVNNFVTVRFEIARARAAFKGICSKLYSNRSLLTAIMKGTSTEKGCGRWKAFLIRRRRSKAVTNEVLLKGRGENRRANKKWARSSLFALATKLLLHLRPETQTVPRWVFCLNWKY